MSLISPSVDGIVFLEDLNNPQGNEDLRSTSGTITFPVILTPQDFDKTKIVRNMAQYIPKVMQVSRSASSLISVTSM